MFANQKIGLNRFYTVLSGEHKLLLSDKKPIFVKDIWAIKLGGIKNRLDFCSQRWNFTNCTRTLIISSLEM